MALRGRRGRAAPAGVAGLPLPVLRAAAERELSRLSLRAAARQIGMSPNALRNFVRGAMPRPTTRARLERWLAVRPEREKGPGLAEFVRLLADVTPDLPARDAEALGRQVSELLRDAYQRRQLPPPRWVRELLRHYPS